MKMGIRTVSMFGFLFGCGLVFAAEIQLPKITETVTVSIVNVDVVVTDAKGNHVRGLTKDDFVVSEDRKPQEITNFSEFDSTPPRALLPTAPPLTTAGEPPPRNLVIFIDTGSIQAIHRGRVFRALKEFLKANISVNDQVMLVTWNRRFKVEVLPTSDVTLIDRALDRVALQVPRSMAMPEEPMLMAFDEGGPAAIAEKSMNRRRIARMTAVDVSQSVRALNVVLARMSGVNGRKALLLVSEGFVIRPFSDDITLDDMAFENQSLIESVVRTANASGVTMYTIHAAGSVALVSAADSSIDAARRRNAFATDSTTSLRSMAAMTGGLIAAGRDDFRGAFSRISEDFNSYYSIGYRATSDRAGRERHIDVRAKDSRYTVRARTTFVERSAETEMRDQVLANLFFAGRANQLRISARLGEAKAAKRGDVIVPVEIAIPLTSLTLLPTDDDKYAGGFFVFIAAGDSNDAMSEIVRRSHRLSFAAADLPKAAGAYYTYAIDVQTARGNRLSIGVLDEISAVTGFTSLKIPGAAQKR